MVFSFAWTLPAMKGLQISYYMAFQELHGGQPNLGRVDWLVIYKKRAAI